VPNTAIARFFGRPQTAAQWLLFLLSAALPAAGYLAARCFEEHPQSFDFRPFLAFAGAWAAAVVLGIIGLWRRVRWTIPAFAVNLILLASGVTAPRFLNPAPILWGERGVYEFAVLADQSLLVCGAEWVHLRPDAAFRESIHQSCGFADVVRPFPDGRVVLGIYDRPMFGDRAGRFRSIESLPENQRIVRGAVATPDGGSILATVSIPGGGARLSKYKADESLDRFWTLQAPEGDWSATPLAWSVAPYADGSAAAWWRDPNKTDMSVIAWHDRDGHIRPDTLVHQLCATCLDPRLIADRDDRVYAVGSGTNELNVRRFSREGVADASFRPDTKALLDAVQHIHSAAGLPRGGLLIGGLKRVVRLDDSGQFVESFSCELESSAREMALQGDRFLVLDGDRLRRFHLDGRPDPSWHMPRLKTRIAGMVTTPVK
jgi:hypothetical protein